MGDQAALAVKESQIQAYTNKKTVPAPVPIFTAVPAGPLSSRRWTVTRPRVQDQRPTVGLVEETREYKPPARLHLGKCIESPCHKKRQRRLLSKVRRKLPQGEKKALKNRRLKLKNKVVDLNGNTQKSSESSQRINKENSEAKMDFKIMNRNLNEVEYDSQNYVNTQDFVSWLLSSCKSTEPINWTSYS